MERKTQKKTKILVMILIILCNLTTLFYVAPLKENLSYLGNELNHRVLLLVWGGSAACYFYYFTRKLMIKHCYNNTIGKLCLLLSCLAMIFSVLMPYDPVVFPQLSKWHIRIAMWSTILYVATFFHFLFDTMKRDPIFFQKSIPLYGMLVGFDLLLFLFYGSVSTLLEISFTIGMVLLLDWMERKIS